VAEPAVVSELVERGVYVLGMHRSGTSAAARLVTLLGVPTCGEDDLLVPTADNPRGYWESASLAAFNDRLLAALGCDWTCPPLLHEGWAAEPPYAALGVDAQQVFRAVLPVPQWAWKDPRNCVTLPFWTASVAAETAVVLVDRDPLEIAASLATRNGFSKPYALALWERYLRLCLETIAGLPALVTRYDELLDDPLTWCERTREFLSRVGFSTTDPPTDEVRAFVEPALRHQRSPGSAFELDPATSPAQRELAAVLVSLRGEHGALPTHGLGDETPSTEALLAERRRARLVERDLQEQYEELEEYARALARQVVLGDRGDD
jgi:hypothetical protein